MTPRQKEKKMEIGNLCADARFTFLQMFDCLRYKLSQNLILVVFVIAVLLLLWRILRVDVRGAG